MFNRSHLIQILESAFKYMTELEFKAEGHGAAP